MFFCFYNFFLKADILWFAQEFKNFENLSSNQIVNQFPNEYW